MDQTVKRLFPHFSNELLHEIESNASYQTIPAGEVIMRTGQYFRNTVLVLSDQIKRSNLALVEKNGATRTFEITYKSN